MIQAGRDAYRDPARNTNSNECLYDAANYPTWTGSRHLLPGYRLTRTRSSPYKHFILVSQVDVQLANIVV